MASYSATSPLALRFCEEYLIDLNGAAAAQRAGYSPKRAKQVASELLHLPAVQARVQQLLAERSERKRIDADDVLAELWAMATADPRELIEYRRSCCRYCWGLDHEYQRTTREIYVAVRDFATSTRRKPGEVFAFANGDGGPGWDARREPHPDCPECFGAGVQDIYVHDTRGLSRRAARLYAGVKTTKDGLEVKMHDQQAALVHVGRHLGMFKEVVEHRDFSIEDLIRDAGGDEAGHAGDA